MTCELETETNDYFSGTSLYSKPYSRCLKETSVYLPPNHDNSRSSLLNVVVWLHGFYVPNNRYLFKNDGVNVRQRVLSSNRDVVLIAPYMGHGYFVGDVASGNFSTSALGEGKWGEKYLSDVLGGLAKWINAKSPPNLDIKNLILACHSGGGSAMRGLVGTLGKYESRLRECWGLDCLYGKNDATFWYGLGKCQTYFYFGPTTASQSVKLYLMVEGLADENGDQVTPSRPARNDIYVGIGHFDAFPVQGQMVSVGNKVNAFADQLITQRQPGAKPPMKGKSHTGEYAAQQAANLLKNFAFIPDIHYTIARKYLQERLSAVSLP